MIQRGLHDHYLVKRGFLSFFVHKFVCDFESFVCQLRTLLISIKINEKGQSVIADEYFEKGIHVKMNALKWASLIKVNWKGPRRLLFHSQKLSADSARHDW